MLIAHEDRGSSDLNPGSLHKGIGRYATVDLNSPALTNTCITKRTLLVRLSRRVFVGNLAYRTTWQHLKDHFGQVGSVVSAEVFGERRRWSKGCGVVDFKTAKEAKQAIANMHDSILNGRRISV